MWNSGSPSAFELAIDPLVRLACQQRRAAGPLAMVLLQIRRVPERHDTVADELVDRTALLQDDFGQCREISRGLQHQHIGIGFLRQRREPRTSVKNAVISCRVPPSSVEMVPFRTPRTISRGARRENDQTARCA